MKYFKQSEVACQCGCGLLPTISIQNLADAVREEWGKPLVCTSAMRCNAHTLALRLRGIPAALRSAHMEGLAIDLQPTNLSELPAFQKFCIERLERWGVWMEDPLACPSWVHLDFRPRPNRIFKP